MEHSQFVVHSLHGSPSPHLCSCSVVLIYLSECTLYSTRCDGERGGALDKHGDEAGGQMGLAVAEEEIEDAQKRRQTAAPHRGSRREGCSRGFALGDQLRRPEQAASEIRAAPNEALSRPSRKLLGRCPFFALLAVAATSNRPAQNFSQISFICEHCCRCRERSTLCNIESARAIVAMQYGMSRILLNACRGT